MKRRSAVLAGVAVSALLLTGCGPGGAPGAAVETAPVSLTIGYFPNLTHAPAIIGLAEGTFAEALGPEVDIKTATFTSGTGEIEALFAGGIDIGFIGPGPTITGWEKSKGAALRVIAGTASGGAALVVRDGIASPGDLAGTVIATPSLGNTQDVAARHWLADQGMPADEAGGGEVSIQPQDNATALTALQTGDIDGAWVPEPWATRMVAEAGAHVLVDERDLWPGGNFVTTNVIVRTEFLQQHPQIVRDFLDGLVETIQSMESGSTDLQQTVTDEIGKITGSTPAVETLREAWDNVTFTWDPLVATLVAQADHAHAVGLAASVDLDGLYDLDPLNAVLAQRGLEPVAGR